MSFSALIIHVQLQCAAVRFDAITEVMVLADSACVLHAWMVKAVHAARFAIFSFLEPYFQTNFFHDSAISTWWAVLAAKLFEATLSVVCRA